MDVPTLDPPEIRTGGPRVPVPAAPASTKLASPDTKLA
jgi:hypothetical protein